MPPSEHPCTYDIKAEDCQKTQDGDLLLIEITPKLTCRHGYDQPRRSGKVRLPTKRIVMAAPGAQASLAPSCQDIALQLSDAPSVIRWTPRQRALLSTWDAKQQADGLRALARSRLINIEERDHPNWKPYAIHVRDTLGLRDLAYPGRRALEENAGQRLATLANAAGVAELAARLASGRRLDDATLTWALRVVEHGATGKKSMVRQFSGGHAGSKDFAYAKASVETILGSLDAFGIFDPGVRLLVHGSGRLRWPQNAIDVRPELGGIGLTLEALSALEAIETRHLYFLENREVLEACASGRLNLPDGCLAMETGGRPGPTVVHAAAIARCGVSIWADIDPAGIRTAHALLQAAVGRGRTINMEAVWLDQANQDTTPDTLADARRLQDLPDPLGALARRIVKDQRWLEMEPQSRSIQGLPEPPAEARATAR